MRPARLVLLPSFAHPRAARLVDFDLVRITLRRPGQSQIVFDTVVTFPAGRDTLSLELGVPIAGLEETFDYALAMYNSALQDTVFVAGGAVTATSNALNVREGRPVLNYVGVGFDAAGVRFVTAPGAAFFGATVNLVAEAFDSGGAAVPGTPIVFVLANPADSVRARIPDDEVGQVLVGQQRGDVGIRAELLTSQFATHTLTVQPTAATIALQAGGSQTGPAGAPLSQPVVARVLANDGLGVEGVEVTFAVTSGGGSLSVTTDTTDTAGDVSTLWTLGGTVGPQAISATAAGVTGVLPVGATATPGAATQLAFQAQPASADEGAVIAPAVTVRALDQFGNPVTTFSGNVTVAIGTNPGGGTLGGTLTRAAVAGVATFDDLTVSVAGNGYTLTATSGTLTATTSAPFNVIATTPVALQFQVQPSGVQAGSVITPAVVVRLVTSSGATAVTATNAVTIGIATNPAAGTLSGTLTVSAVAGLATFSDLAIDNIGSGYELLATATGLTAATSAAFDVLAPANAVSWINPAGGNWSVGANWSTGTVPAALDTVFIRQTGTYTVVLDVTITVGRLDVGGPGGVQTLAVGSNILTIAGASAITTNGRLLLSGGTINGTGTLDVFGQADWSGGNFSGGAGTTRIMPGGQLTISTTAARTLNNYTIENRGAAFVTHDVVINSGSGGTIRNAAGATFDMQSGGQLLFNQGGAASRFDNLGTFTSYPGTGQTTFTAPFDNSGSVVTQTGFTQLSGGGTHSGSFSAGIGTVLIFGGGTHSLSAASSVGGAGEVRIAAGTVTAAGGWAVTSPTRVQGGSFNYDNAAGGSTSTLILSGGTFGGSGLMQVTGLMTWTAGSVIGGGGTLLVPSGAALAMSPANFSLNSHTLEVGGSGTWTGTGTINSGSGGILRVLAGGTLDIQGDPSLLFNQGGAPSRLEVQGGATLTRSLSPGSVSVSAEFDNDGQTTVSSGSLLLSGGSGAGTADGTYTINLGALVVFSGGTHTLGAPSSITGSGLVSVTGGALFLGGAYAIGGSTQVSGGSFFYNGAGSGSTATLTVSGGAVGGAGLLTVSGALNWTGGSFASGGGTTRALGASTASLGGAATIVLNNYTVEIGGTGTWTGLTNMNSGSGGTLRVMAGAVFDLQSNPSINFNQGGAPSRLHNQGTLNRTTSAGTVAVTALFDNDGAVSVQAGTLRLAGGGTSIGSFAVNAGTILEYAGGTHDVGAASSVSGTGTVRVVGGTAQFTGAYTLTGSGLTDVNGGTAAFSSAVTASTQTLTLQSGTLGGNGLLSVPGSFTWSGGSMTGGTGTTRVEAGGSLSITTGVARTLGGGYTLAVAGTGTWVNGTINSGSAATLRVLAGGTLEVQDGSFLFNQGGTPSRLEVQNGGTVTRTTSVTAVTITAEYDNDGQTIVSAGTLNLNGGSGAGTADGVYQANTIGTIAFGNGTHALGAASVVSGTGTVQVGGGTVNAAGAWSVTSPTQVNGGTLNYNNAGGGSTGALDLSAGTLGGSGLFTVTGAMTWTGGSVQGGGGTLRLGPAGTLAISGTAGRTLNNHALEIGGAATWSGAFTLSSGSGAVLRILPTGSLNWTADAVFAFNQGGTPPVFVNEGSFSVATGSPALAARVQVFYVDTVSSLLAVTSGDLMLTSGGRLGGAPSIGAGAFIEPTGGTLGLKGGLAISGAGTFRINGATIALDSGTTGSIPNVELLAGSLTHEGDLTISSAFTWDAGTIASNIVGLGGATHAANLTISGAAAKSLSGAHLLDIGTGTVYSGSGNINTGGGAQIQSNGTFDWQGDGQILFNQGGAVPQFVFAGTLRRSTSANPAVLDMAVNTAGGTFEVQTGTLRLTGGSAFNIFGNATVTAGALLEFGGGTFTLTSSFNVTGDLTVSAGSLVLADRTMGVTGTFTTTGTGTLVMTSPADVLDIGGNAVFGGGTSTLDTGVIQVGGDFTQTGGASFAPNAARGHRVVLDGSGTQNLSFANTTSSFFRRLDINKTGGSVVLTGNVRAGRVRTVSATNVTGVAGPPITRLIADTIWGPSIGSSYTTPLVIEWAGPTGSLRDSGNISVDTMVFTGNGQFIPNVGPGFGTYTFNSIRVTQSPSTAVASFANTPFTIPGDLIITSGAIQPNGAKISVGGNLRTENNGFLVMNGAGDSIGVTGNANFQGASTSAQLTNGILTIGESFFQGGAINAFQPSVSHRVRFEGSTPGAKTIQFTSPTISRFNRLDLARQTGSGQTILLQSDVIVLDTLMVRLGTEVMSATTERLRGGRFRYVGGVQNPIVRPFVLEVTNTIGMDTTNPGQITFRPDTLVFMGTASYSMPFANYVGLRSVRVATTGLVSTFLGAANDTLAGDLVVSAGRFQVTAGTTVRKLKTQGTGSLEMNTAGITLTVRDSAIFAGATSNPFLNAGTIRLEGHFFQAGDPAAYNGDPPHTVEFAGTSAQTVFFTNPGFTAALSHFPTVRFANNSAGGVTFLSDVFTHILEDVTAGTQEPVFGSGFLLTTQGANVDNVLFNNTRLSFLDSFTYTRFDNATFQNYPGTPDILTVALSANPPAFAGLVFPTAGFAGRYLVANEVGGGPLLAVTLTGASPGPGSGLCATTGSATISWNGGAC